MSIELDCEETSSQPYIPSPVKPPELWNGRSVQILQEDTPIRFYIPPLNKITPRNRDIEAYHEETVEELLERSGYTFDTGPLYYIELKSLMHRLKTIKREAAKGCRRLGKVFKKGAQKTTKVAKKVFHQSVDFVKDNKRECIIAAAVIAAITLGVTIGGAILAASAAAKKEDDDPTDPSPDPIPENPNTKHYVVHANPLTPPPENVPFAETLNQFFDLFKIAPDMNERLDLTPHDPDDIPPTLNKHEFTAPPAARPSPENKVNGLWDIFQFKQNAPSDFTQIFPPSVLKEIQIDSKKFSQEVATQTQNMLKELTPLRSTYANFLALAQAHATGYSNLETAFSIGDCTVQDPLKSTYYYLDGHKLPNTLVTCTNGIGNSFKDALANARHLQKLCDNVAIEGIYNHSNTPLVDLLEVGVLNYNGYSPITQDLLIQKWTEFHKMNKNNPSAQILHYCHSQGAIHTDNALKRLPQEIRDRIIVVAIAPAIIIRRELCRDSYNYASTRDFVHYGELVHSFLKIGGSGTLKFLDICAHRDELILLDPHKDASGPDHNFDTLTFAEVIRDHYDECLKKSF